MLNVGAVYDSSVAHHRLLAHDAHSSQRLIQLWIYRCQTAEARRDSSFLTTRDVAPNNQSKLSLSVPTRTELKITVGREALRELLLEALKWSGSGLLVTSS